MIYYELLEDGTIGRSTNSEKVAQMNGYYNEKQVVENENDIFYDVDGKRYLKKDNLEKFNQILKKEKNTERIAEIKLWFEEYDNQVKQYERCRRLGIEFDKDIVELDNQAKAYQEELRQLKQEV